MHIFIYPQGFIEAILISGRRKKTTQKLNLLIEFLNSVFIKFPFKVTGVELAFRIINLQIFFYFKLFMCSLDVKRSKYFKAFIPPNPHRELAAELTAPQDPHVRFTTFESSIFVQKRTLERLLG